VTLRFSSTGNPPPSLFYNRCRPRFPRHEGVSGFLPSFTPQLRSASFRNPLLLIRVFCCRRRVTAPGFCVHGHAFAFPAPPRRARRIGGGHFDFLLGLQIDDYCQGRRSLTRSFDRDVLTEASSSVSPGVVFFLFCRATSDQRPRSPRLKRIRSEAPPIRAGGGHTLRGSSLFLERSPLSSNQIRCPGCQEVDCDLSVSLLPAPKAWRGGFLSFFLFLLEDAVDVFLPCKLSSTARRCMSLSCAFDRRFGRSFCFRC